MKSLLYLFTILVFISSCSANEGGCVSVLSTQPPIRGFMSHRGVHLKSTVAGENSLEAIVLARRAGFWCIETDTRYTSDSVLVIMHDGTINRTCVNVDGSEIDGQVEVASLTFDELRSNYRLKASEEKNRVVVPTLKEYLQVCKENGFLVFIEPKLKDSTGRFYADIMREADEVLGRDGYVITSNNFANGIIRDTLEVQDAALMGLLYQTDYETMQRLGNIVFAVSSTAFSTSDYHRFITRAFTDGYWIQSACGLLSLSDSVNLEKYNLILSEGDRINLIATDICAPDYTGQGRLIAESSSTDVAQIEKELSSAGTIGFGAVYIDLTYSGSASLAVGPDSFILKNRQSESVSYSRMVYDTDATVLFGAVSDDFRIENCSIRIVEY